jgi:putative transposase
MSIFASIMCKRSYHPFLIIGYKTGILPQTIAQTLPRSTRHHWQHKNLESAYGHCWYAANQQQLAALKQVYQSKRLMQLNMALLRLFAVKRFMHRHAAALKQGLQNVPVTVYNNIKKSAAVLGNTKALKYIGLSHAQLQKFKHKVRCTQSPLNICRIKHPAQLLPAEATAIKQVCTDEQYKYWPLSSVYYAGLRAGKIVCHISTFYKYVTALGLRRYMPGKRRLNHHTGIRAEKPLQVIHADVTLYRMADNVKVFIYAVVDNCSRMPLALVAYTEKKAEYMFDTLTAVYERYLKNNGCEDCILLTDGGSENMGKVKELVTAAHHTAAAGCTCGPTIQHLIAQVDVDFSNSMAEHTIKELKYHWLYHHKVNNIDQLNKLLAQHIEKDSHRPRAVHKGLTPAEIMDGHLPASQSYAPLLRKAAETRLMENRKIKCCGFSF